MIRRLVAVALLALSPGLAPRVAGQGMASWTPAGPAFVQISVSDLEASVEWYSRVLGLDVVREVDYGDGSASVRLLRRDDLVVELIAHADPIALDPSLADRPGFRSLGLFKSGFFVEGIEALHEWLAAQSVETDARIGTDGALAMRTFIFRDPDGNRLQAFESCEASCGGPEVRAGAPAAAPAAPAAAPVTPATAGGPAAGEFSAVLPHWCADHPRPGYASLARIPVASEWFEVYAVGNGVYAIYEPNQWQEVISYLILGSERALLFDTGMGIASIRELVSGLTGLPVVVLNSHTHFDHVGGNWEFDHVIGMETEFTRESAAGSPNEEVREEVSTAALCGPLPAGVTEDSYVGRPFEVAEFVTDGHRISLGPRTLEILHVPGHTDDAIALLDRETGYLWTGDTFYEGPIWLFWPGTDLAAYGRSTERLAALVPELTRVFPAHNTPVADPVRLTELRDAFRGALDGTLEGVVREDGLVSYEVGSFSLLLQPPDRR
jgi:glyoxylase-like metal-dependent hydrolase (beta-lactamase superfamily II)/catechol 2,3-dioxygenase-like lactoylglutathione lyase family enzyme